MFPVVSERERAMKTNLNLMFANNTQLYRNWRHIFSRRKF